MKKEKGFTLIELLAVIVILAIILLIATPIILNIIEGVKKGAFKSSAHEYVKAAEYKYLEKMLDGSGQEKIFTYVDGELQEEENLNYGGESPKNGTIHITKDGKIAIAIHNGKWCAMKNYDNSKITLTDDTEDDCKIENLPETVVFGYDNEKGVNKPALVTGMTPIIYNESTGLWLDVSEEDANWYDYTSKKWANARTADGSMWVWIPRYAYKITSGYHSSETGEIDIKFLKGTSNKPTDKTKIEINGYEAGVKDTSMYYFLHPVFQFDGEKLGFWVAKFEATAAEGIYSGSSTCDVGDNVTTKTVKIIPNVTTWRCINPSNAFDVSLNMKNKTDVYEWSTNEVDTHLIKNTEWGAVTYLSKSKYGAHTEEVWNNSFNEHQTGCSGWEKDDINNGICMAYNTLRGTKASTTHNVYGVYDMSGGAWEQVSGYVNNGHNNLEIYGISLIDSINDKYKNVYNSGSPDIQANNYELNKNIYGDAVYETSFMGDSPRSSWYEAYSNMPYDSSPFFLRGGDWSYDSSPGLNAFGNMSGSAFAHISFRPVVFTR